MSIAGEPARSDLASGVSTNLSYLVVEVKPERGPGTIPAYRAYVSDGTNKFAFLLPEGSGVSPGDPRKVTLISADHDWSITVRFLKKNFPGEKQLDAGAWRELVLKTYPGAQIAEEFSLAAANRNGPAFDLRWNGPDGSPRLLREAFIPLADGTMEFSLDSSPEKVSQARAGLNFVMVTFRASDVNGSLIVPPLSINL